MGSEEEGAGAKGRLGLAGTPRRRALMNFAGSVQGEGWAPSNVERAANPCRVA